ncbi:unnamed protein product [Candidula unifasciata]|uniref:BZIP domain-containing protein n=1 Tax=Candidula unifasciata TaxID=100452 RepID=A0A8S3ZN36_9EUPU|nr:unnamed protein product [Candidula unifasciata]
MTVNKKPVSSTKMDLFVPGSDCSAHFPMSSMSSIYDNDRPHFLHCGNPIFTNTSMESGFSDDMCGLDDNMEDGCLENFLTPDVMNSFSQATTLNPSSEFSWAGKLEHDVSMPAVSDSLSPNPTLAQLDMEPDISLVNDIIGTDQDDSKLNFVTLDYFCGDMNDFSSQPSFTCAPSSSPGSAFGYTSSTDIKKFSETIATTSADKFLKQTGSSIDSNFPPRVTQPQLIGVAAVIKPEMNNSLFSDDVSDGLTKLKAQSPNLHKLLSTNHPLAVIKSEISSPPRDVTEKESAVRWHADSSVQIVPSSGAGKRTHVKSEPLSPKAGMSEETMEEKWKDIQHFMHSPGEQSRRKRRRFDSASSEYISDDDDDDEDDDDVSQHGGKYIYVDSDDDYSDIDADLAHITPSECESLVAVGKKQKQFFWQYNVQSKGPKGTRLKLSVESPADPHVLNDFEDPVFDECNTAIAGIRHGGKARKGDGNEITPNPRKLFMIGHQLLRLNRQINACQLGNDVPAARRNESRKEKNKLASRACRLKKKAQHEANKIKLYGLEQEHSQLNSVLKFIWPNIREKTKALLGHTDKAAVSSSSTNLTGMLESQITESLKSMIAGHTTNYVNSVIINVERGDNSGGLNLKRNHKT